MSGIILVDANVLLPDPQGIHAPNRGFADLEAVAAIARTYTLGAVGEESEFSSQQEELQYLGLAGEDMIEPELIMPEHMLLGDIMADAVQKHIQLRGNNPNIAIYAGNNEIILNYFRREAGYPLEDGVSIIPTNAAIIEYEPHSRLQLESQTTVKFSMQQLREKEDFEKLERFVKAHFKKDTYIGRPEHYSF